ncbi:MAG TPA: hypothetical protein VG032_10715 [Acidimicrobiales bacterium]|nr:hypothetical protein [Acidimicrobiales bacterium]
MNRFALPDLPLPPPDAGKGSPGTRHPARPTLWQQARAGVERRRDAETPDSGLTLVELLVAFSALIILLIMVATALTTYLNVGTNVVSSYNATDQLLPGSIIIQRLIRSEVQPAPTPTSTSIPVPAFLPGTVGTVSTTFYANIGDPNGPAKIVMASSAPTLCSGCRFKTSQFTVYQYVACPKTPAGSVPTGCASSGVAGCPFTTVSANTCTWSTVGTEQVTINGVVNGQTGLAQASTPIFTYNTLDPYSSAFVAGAGGTPSPSTGLLPNFAAGTCAAPTLTGGIPSQSNCLANTIQSVGVDVQVQVTGAPFQENSFVVYRLSSASYLYSPLVG